MVYGLGVGVEGLGFGAWILGSGVESFGLRLERLEFQASGLRLRD